MWGTPLPYAWGPPSPTRGDPPHVQGQVFDSLIEIPSNLRATWGTPLPYAWGTPLPYAWGPHLPYARGTPLPYAWGPPPLRVGTPLPYVGSGFRLPSYAWGTPLPTRGDPPPLRVGDPLPTSKFGPNERFRQNLAKRRGLSGLLSQCRRMLNHCGTRVGQL